MIEPAISFLNKSGRFNTILLFSVKEGSCKKNANKLSKLETWDKCILSTTISLY